MLLGNRAYTLQQDYAVTSTDDLRVNAHKNRPKSPINGTSRKIDFAYILPIDRS